MPPIGPRVRSSALPTEALVSPTPLVPAQTLRVNQPNYISFSDNARFVMVENANSFHIYDAETEHGYLYRTNQPIDAPQQHAEWMDGHRLTYVSGGKLIVFDFDSVNVQTLMPALPGYVPFFDQSYRFVYSLAPATTGGTTALTSTSLLTPADQ